MRLKEDFEVKCYEGAHYTWAFYVALPSLILWGIGIPFFAFLLLRRRRDTLEEVDTKKRFGFLIKGFKKRFYFWEIIIMYRKIMLIIISVVIERFGAIT